MSAEGWNDYGGRTYPKCPLCGGETTKLKRRFKFAPNSSKCTHCGAISEGEHGKIFDSFGTAILPDEAWERDDEPAGEREYG